MPNYPDLSLIQQKLTNSTQKINPYALRIEKPKVAGAKNSVAVRILPNPHNDNGWYFTDAWFHYNLGNSGTVACPKNNQMEPCAVCDHVSEIYSKTNEIAEARNIDSRDTTEKRKVPEILHLFNIAKDLRAKKRIYAPVIVRGKESEGVKFWGMSPTLYEKLFEYIAGRKRNILDPYAGYDCIVSFKNTDSDFGEYSFDFQLDDDASPIIPNGDKAAIDAVINSVPNIWGSLLESKTSAEVSKIFAQLVDIQNAVHVGNETHTTIDGGNETELQQELSSSVDETIDQFKRMLESD